MMKITHREIDDLNSLQDHPGRKTFVSIIQSKIENISEQIDQIMLTKKSDEVTFTVTETKIIRKLFLKEVILLPLEITDKYKWDQNIANANKVLADRFKELEKD